MRNWLANTQGNRTKANYAKPKNVISNPNRPTVQQINDNDKMKKGNPSQNQKSCKADTQANAICSTFAFAQPHKDDNP